MEIVCFPLGMMQTNCYLAYDENMEAYFFDCGGENLEKLFAYIEKNNLNLKYIVLTHGHGDHIEGLNKLANKFKNAKVYIGTEEKDFLYDSSLSLSNEIFGKNFSFDGEINLVKEGDKIGNFTVIDTPGHTIGSKCFYSKENNILISGDTLFKRSYGRFDLPTGSRELLFSSLKKLSKLPDETIVYSGHSEVTKIADEKLFLKYIGIID